ncbi:MAG TPA: rubrerythrin [Bacteroidales bacterium]|nr:rubrerythrin [Bacteroidales bacterium]
MNRFLLILLSCFTFTGVAAQTDPAKTMDDLKTAYNGESSASVKYAKYAEVAKKEGYLNIARMFEATSRAESIHAANHLAVMKKLGGSVSGPVLEPVRPGTTAENLADGIKGETWEYESMYPPMIKTAEAAELYDAVTTFRYARDTEKRHRGIYEKALTAMKAGQEKFVSATWYVCPTCGNTYDSADLAVSCEFCGTLRPRFIIFK